MSPMMVSTSPVLGGVLFIAAGLYQWTLLKRACLRNCRSPLEFVTGRWREGARGALRMEAKHGLYCLGCCWVLMGLLVAVGEMSLVWIAALAALVAVEKIAPGGEWLARASGAAAAATGVALLFMA
jgi:predicted metal-binding membrane protein